MNNDLDIDAPSAGYGPALVLAQRRSADAWDRFRDAHRAWVHGDAILRSFHPYLPPAPMPVYVADELAAAERAADDWWLAAEGIGGAP